MLTASERTQDSKTSFYTLAVPKPCLGGQSPCSFGTHDTHTSMCLLSVFALSFLAHYPSLLDAHAHFESPCTRPCARPTPWV